MPQGTKLKGGITGNCGSRFDLATNFLCSVTVFDSVFPSEMTG